MSCLAELPIEVVVRYIFKYLPVIDLFRLRVSRKMRKMVIMATTNRRIVTNEKYMRIPRKLSLEESILYVQKRNGKKIFRRSERARELDITTLLEVKGGEIELLIGRILQRNVIEDLSTIQNLLLWSCLYQMEGIALFLMRKYPGRLSKRFIFRCHEFAMERAYDRLFKKKKVEFLKNQLLTSLLHHEGFRNFACSRFYHCNIYENKRNKFIDLLNAQSLMLVYPDSVNVYSIIKCCRYRYWGSGELGELLEKYIRHVGNTFLRRCYFGNHFESLIRFLRIMCVIIYPFRRDLIFSELRNLNRELMLIYSLKSEIIKDDEKRRRIIERELCTLSQGLYLSDRGIPSDVFVCVKTFPLLLLRNSKEIDERYFPVVKDFENDLDFRVIVKSSECRLFRILFIKLVSSSNYREQLNQYLFYLFFELGDVSPYNLYVEELMNQPDILKRFIDLFLDGVVKDEVSKTKHDSRYLFKHDKQIFDFTKEIIIENRGTYIFNKRHDPTSDLELLPYYLREDEHSEVMEEEEYYAERRECDIFGGVDELFCIVLSEMEEEEKILNSEVKKGECMEYYRRRFRILKLMKMLPEDYEHIFQGRKLDEIYSESIEIQNKCRVIDLYLYEGFVFFLMKICNADEEKRRMICEIIHSSVDEVLDEVKMEVRSILKSIATLYFRNSDELISDRVELLDEFYKIPYKLMEDIPFPFDRCVYPIYGFGSTIQEIKDTLLRRGLENDKFVSRRRERDLMYDKRMELIKIEYKREELEKYRKQEIVRRRLIEENERRRREEKEQKLKKKEERREAHRKRMEEHKLRREEKEERREAHRKLMEEHKLRKKEKEEAKRKRREEQERKRQERERKRIEEQSKQRNRQGGGGRVGSSFYNQRRGGFNNTRRYENNDRRTYNKNHDYNYNGNNNNNRFRRQMRSSHDERNGQYGQHHHQQQQDYGYGNVYVSQRRNFDYKNNNRGGNRGRGGGGRNNNYRRNYNNSNNNNNNNNNNNSNDWRYKDGGGKGDKQNDW